MSPLAKEILQKAAGWPEEDQEELAELAREIEARRTGVYVLSDEERSAIADARRGAFVSDAEAAAFWKRHGIQ
jgi:site-specific DNA-adenine methylase